MLGEAGEDGRRSPFRPGTAILDELVEVDEPTATSRLFGVSPSLSSRHRRRPASGKVPGAVVDLCAGRTRSPGIAGPPARGACPPREALGHQPLLPPLLPPSENSVSSPQSRPTVLDLGASMRDVGFDVGLMPSVEVASIGHSPPRRSSPRSCEYSRIHRSTLPMMWSRRLGCALSARSLEVPPHTRAAEGDQRDETGDIARPCFQFLRQRTVFFHHAPDQRSVRS